jgi:hypothetical protein
MCLTYGTFLTVNSFSIAWEFYGGEGLVVRYGPKRDGLGHDEPDTDCLAGIPEPHLTLIGRSAPQHSLRLNLAGPPESLTS